MKDKLYSMFYCGWIQNLYRSFSCDEKEEIYTTKNKLIIILKDKMLGEKVYDIISDMNNKEFWLGRINFKISNCTAVKKVITSFTMSFQRDPYLTESNRNNFIWTEYGGLKKLQKIVFFISEMAEQGYFLDESKFEFKDFDTVSELFSFFTTDPKEKKNLTGLLVKYVHYFLTGVNDFEEFYSEIDKKVFFEFSEIPYDINIIKMCYQYYLEGKISRSVNYFLCNSSEIYLVNKYGYYRTNHCLLVMKGRWEQYVADRKNNEYSIYGNVKVINELSSDFRDFLTYAHIEIDVTKLCLENVEKTVIDLDGNIVGYKITSDSDDSSISDMVITEQSKLFKFLKELESFISNTRKLKKLKKISSEIDLDKIITYSDTYYWNFKFKTLSQLFYFFGTSKDDILVQFTKIFCKLYKNLVDSKYGITDSPKELMSRPEIRYLRPILAKEFIKFYLGKKTNWATVYKELNKFFDELTFYEKSPYNDMYYDTKFIYDPFKIPFNFDYEIEEKYEIDCNKCIKESLPDGRILITFGYSKELFSLDTTRIRNLDKIGSSMGLVKISNHTEFIKTNDHIEFIDISEIIYSQDIADDGRYSFIGYITTPAKGKPFNTKTLLKLNNKELMYVFGYYYSQFSEYTFSNEYVQMDSDFVFYINILTGEVCRPTGAYTVKEKKYINKLIKILKGFGYNSNAFICIDTAMLNHYNCSRYLIDLADSFDNYCDEHKIYYAGTDCPACLKFKYYLSDDFMENATLVFEDKIAKHYKINQEYNLKFYNAETIDMSDIEQRIDKIITSLDLYNYEQEGFIPVKKAYNNNNQFVGYIYDSIDFNSESNIDLRDLEKMKNLPRLKALLRLLLQIQTLLINKMAFSKNPYGSVFLNKNFKKQVQILNIELLDTNVKGNKSDTIKWTCKYVLSVIKSDETFKFVGIDKVIQMIDEILLIPDVKLSYLESIVKKINKIVTRMTKYCSIHHFYYDKGYIYCPKCSESIEEKGLQIKQISKKKITSFKELGEGGEALIYECYDGHVAKVFRESGDINYNIKINVISKIMQKAETLKETSKNAQYEYIVPEEILVDNSQMYGYIMKKVVGLPISVLKDKQVIKKLGFTKKDILEILITVGNGIEGLHNNNIFIGDLNGRNILFNTSKRVFFLDFDGMGVDDISPDFCTDGYIDPISKKKHMITEKDDWYSFAVQAFYYLTYTHPFNGIYMEAGKTLDIPEKMERRISLLGNHGIEVPKIAESWNWMNAELKNTFYQIFEKELRISIIPYLTNQYNSMYAGEESSSIKEVPIFKEQETIRINSKFIAKNINPFGDENIIYVINLNVAICEQNGNRYAIVLTKSHKYILKNILYLASPKSIRDVIISKNEYFAFVILTNNKLFVVDLEKDEVVRSISWQGYDNIAVKENSVFYIDFYESYYENLPVIYKETFTDGGEVKQEKFEIPGEQEIPRCIGVSSNEKVIIVENDVDGEIIYCNNMVFGYMSSTSQNTRYNVIYDDLTKTWLIINQEGYLIVINEKGSYERFQLDNNIRVSDVRNITYTNGNMYIPDNGCLWIIKLKNNSKCKKMECHKIMDSTSRICGINRNGFTVLTNGKLYDVCRE